MHYVTFSFIFWLAIETVLSQSLVQIYDSKVCNNEPTCNLTISEAELLKNRLTLERRDCMCDSACVEYGDCCADSKFYSPSSTGSGKKFSCPPNWKVYILTSCPAGYTNQAVVSKCLASLKPLEGPDNSVIRPATNINKRITYGNVYCAVCNNDFDITLWNLSARCGEPPAGYLDSSTPISTTSKPVETSTQVLSSPKPSNPPKVEISTTSEKPRITATTRKSFFPFSLGGRPTSKPTSNSNSNSFLRLKRQQPAGIDFNKYRKDINQILENVHYDSAVQRFVSQYNGKSFVCEFSSQMPKDFESNLRICVPGMVSSCPPYADRETARKCSSNTAIVYEKILKTPYKNKYCARCNNVKESDLTGCPQAQRQSGSDIFNTANAGATPPCNNPEIKDTPMCQAGR